MTLNTKGQLISECPKIPQKILQISALESKKWPNHKIKALYNVFNTLNNKFDHMYYKKVQKGQKSVKFFGGFLDILKLTDL